MKKMDINMFSDSDHRHDNVSGRSITGAVGFVGRTPVLWMSTRQLSVQTSNFGAEFLALRTAVQDTVTI